MNMIQENELNIWSIVGYTLVKHSVCQNKICDTHTPDQDILETNSSLDESHYYLPKGVGN